MGKILGDSPKEDFPVPERVVSLLVDEDPTGACARPVTMAFIKGTEAGVICTAVGQPRVQALPVATPVQQMPVPTPVVTPGPGPGPVPPTTPPPMAAPVVSPPKGQTP